MTTNKSRVVWTMFSVVTLFLFTTQACTRNEAFLPQTAQEFIVTSDTLKTYLQWPIRGTEERPDIGQFRTIYINNPEIRAQLDGNFPIGTIIIKELRNYWNQDEIVRFQIMVKRGGDFNMVGNGWEWILTENLDDLSSRGGIEVTLANGATCVSCHAPENDFVFNVYVDQ